ncbi:CrcB family protein [Streptomyces kanasensis]|uniref:FluC/FEX family fluoride channel n=1 Tax=Streptomyces kanasensis TaxID=936756 RepID=UPI0036FD71BF
MNPLPTRPRAVAAADWPLIGTVALGGALGSGARYGLWLLWPTAPGVFPWATLWTNVVGCALMGVLTAVLDASPQPRAHRLLRPLLATGALGGFTTVSAYALETRALLEGGRTATALAYLAGTLVAALLAVTAAARATRAVLARRSPTDERGSTA